MLFCSPCSPCSEGEGRVHHSSTSHKSIYGPVGALEDHSTQAAITFRGDTSKDTPSRHGTRHVTAIIRERELMTSIPLESQDLFDAFDTDSTTAWLQSFERLGEEGPHGKLYGHKAAVVEFEVGGGDDSWLTALKNEEKGLAIDWNAEIDANCFSEISSAELEKLLEHFLTKSQAYRQPMLKPEVAAAWARSFVASLEGSTFYTNGADVSEWNCVSTATFDRIFVGSIGNRCAAVVLVDED